MPVLVHSYAHIFQKSVKETGERRKGRHHFFFSAEIAFLMFAKVA
ncbi:MAG: hypothetical protein V8T87_05230 [Victivallales bacterium]